MTCKGCGCSDLAACVDAETGARCSWVLPGLCSFCWEQGAADPDNPVLEAADAFNREQLGLAPAAAAPLLYDAYNRPLR